MDLTNMIATVVLLGSIGTAAPDAPTGVSHIAQGHITSTIGQAVPGATVELLLQDYEGTPVHEPLIEQVVIAAKSDASGHFSLSVPSSVVKHDLIAHNGGVANLEMRVTTAAGTTIGGPVTRVWNGRSWLATTKDGQTVSTDNDMLQVSTAETSRRLASLASTSYCRWYKAAPDAYGAGNVWEWHSVSKTDSTWEYEVQANSTISMGIQYGPSSSWGMSGTRTIANTNSAQVTGSVVGSRHTYATTSFNHSYWVARPDSPATYCSNYLYLPDGSYRTFLPGGHMVVPTSWVGGASQRGTLSTIVCSSTSPYAVPHAQNSTFKKTAGNSGTLSGSATTPWGVSLNISSSMGTTRTLYWKWTRGAGYACGSNGPPTTSSVVYVG